MTLFIIGVVLIGIGFVGGMLLMAMFASFGGRSLKTIFIPVIGSILVFVGVFLVLISSFGPGLRLAILPMGLIFLVGSLVAWAFSMDFSIFLEERFLRRIRRSALATSALGLVTTVIGLVLAITYPWGSQ